MSSEALSDFSAQWCQTLLNSPVLINISTKDRRPQPPSDRILPNTLFSETLKTETTIRAWQILQAKHADPSNLSPALFLLMSLGSGLEGYKGILHGGMMGAVMDQVTSMCAVFTAGPKVVTADLNLTYKKSVSLPSVVLCSAKATRREGRKLWVQGTIEDGTGTIFCQADAVFVTERCGKM